MNNSITQANQNDKQISKSIKRFFMRFHISSALKAANAYKKKGIPVVEVFQYLFLLIFSNRSMYMSLITRRTPPGFAKDTVYRFMKMLQINWIRFTTLLASRIIRDAIVPLDSECSHWDGQMAVPSCLSTVSFSHRRIKRTGPMRLRMSISGPQGTGAFYVERNPRNAGTPDSR